MKTKAIFLILFVIPSCFLFAQSGIITGKLLDDEGIPIPGASIRIKGKNTGTQTDFDGNYSLNCEVGDVLIISYIGFASKEVKISSKMFDGKLNTEIAKNIAVKPIITDDYRELLKQIDKPEFQIPDINSSSKKYTHNHNYFDFSHIKKIETGKNQLKVKIYPEEVRFEIGLEQRSSLQFVQRRNLPLLQNEFAQGRPDNENLAWFGPDMNEVFSFGPGLANLEYNGQAYVYDLNGRLVGLGEGIGRAAEAYDNTIFRTGVKMFTAANFRIHSNSQRLYFKYANSNFRDLFNESGNKTHFVDFNYTKKGSVFRWDGTFQYNNSTTGNANINALHNQIYLSHLITPPSFSNSQGFNLEEGNQRSFSPQNFNNPNWLLEQNRNEFQYQFLKANVKNQILAVGNLDLQTGVTFSKQSEDMLFDLPPNTNGFIEGYRSLKDIDSEEILMDLSASYADINISDNFYLSPYSSISFNNTRLDYSLFEASPTQESNRLEVRRSKWTVQLRNRLELGLYSDFQAKLTLQNNSFSSTIQGSKWFLPSLKFYLLLNSHNLGYSDFLTSISLSGGFSKEVFDFPLYYDNLSHNSLQLNIEDSLGYTTNNDLFISSNLSFEEVSQFDLETKISLFNDQIELAASYYNSVNENSIFPLFNEGAWQLQNIAEIRNEGFETTLHFYLNRYHSSAFQFDTKFVFSLNRPSVKEIYDENLERVPIAGFERVSKNLIEGRAAGLLVGTAFLKNENKEPIIGNEGFPLVDPELQIIGNPIPDFNLGWSNTLEYKGLRLSFLFDYQKGGDIWNGTQNSLNYFGVSDESVRLRAVTNFVFQGFDQAGNPNSIPVDFAPSNSNLSQNRWVRYGLGGVAEEAISDGTYLNLKSVSLAYKVDKASKKAFFKEMSFGLFAKNIWNWTKTRGANPYSALFGASSADGLNFFNLPLASEVGININFKI